MGKIMPKVLECCWKKIDVLNLWWSEIEIHSYLDVLESRCWCLANSNISASWESTSSMMNWQAWGPRKTAGLKKTSTSSGNGLILDETLKLIAHTPGWLLEQICKLFISSTRGHISGGSPLWIHQEKKYSTAKLTCKGPNWHFFTKNNMPKPQRWTLKPYSPWSKKR